MADEPTLEEVVAEQRATDPRLDARAPDPAPEPDPQPASESDPEPVAAEAEPEIDPAPPEEGKKPKKTAVEVLTGRVGHLTKVVNAKDAELAEARRRADAAEALLAAGNRTPPDGETAPPAPLEAPPGPANGRTYTQAEFDAQVALKAAADAFNKQADAMYDAGSAKFPDWKESVELLNAAGLMSRDLLDAAMATDDGSAVIHHLGNDLDEASRLAGLTPIHMTVELAKLAAKLTAPAKVRTSGAPAPITPVGGAVSPSIDLAKVAADGGNDMSGYAAARAKQGARWAQPRGQRT